MAGRGVFDRLLAITLMGALTGAAVALHQPPGTATTSSDPHAGHIIAKAIPAAVTTPAPLPRGGWTVAADSAGGSTPAANVLDGDAATTWRTAATALPHTLTVDTHNSVAIGGLDYLPPSDSANGRVGQYRITTSNDGTTWSAPIATGTFADDAVRKTATFGTVITRFVRLTAVTEAGNRGTWSAAAEIDLLGGTDPTLSRAGWTVTADSAETAEEDGAAANVLDGNTATIWHSAWSTDPVPPLPHRLVVDMHVTNLVSGLSYLPRQDGAGNGTIGQYRVETSSDGTTWGPAASGTFPDVATAQTVMFGSALARYVRLTALTEAGGRGPWSSAAEINLLGRPNPTLPRTGWTVTADSAESVEENTPAGNVLDGNVDTIWHSRWSSDPPAPLPHTLTVDLKSAVPIGGLSYLPRPADESNGRIGRYSIESSTNGTAWTSRVTSGTFPDSAALQTVVFPSASARYVRLTALTEAGGRGPWSSAAEINILGPTGSVVSQRGSWGAPIGFPLVPVAAAQLPNGKILTWSSYAVDQFSDSPGGLTITATYNPATGTVTQRTVSQTGHDMFCPGISALPDGRIIVTGGNDSDRTSIYNPATDAWTSGPDMITPRGYQASATLSTGQVFTIGGSWSGGVGGVDTGHKAGEVWSAANGWKALPGASVVPMLTADANPNGDYRRDNHAWLFAWSNGTVLQAGPSRAMNWYSTDGTGGVTPAGTRGDDTDAMNGNAVMYDTGKILTIGGAPSYEQANATANAYVLTITGSTVTTRLHVEFGRRIGTRSLPALEELDEARLVGGVH